MKIRLALAAVAVILAWIVARIAWFLFVAGWVLFSPETFNPATAMTIEAGFWCFQVPLMATVAVLAFYARR